MYKHISWVGPGGKYISRNIHKGVLSNVIIILRHIVTCACVACAMSAGMCEVARSFLLSSVVAAVLRETDACFC